MAPVESACTHCTGWLVAVIGGALAAAGLGSAGGKGRVCRPVPPAVVAVSARMRPSSVGSAAAVAALLAGVVDVYGECSCKYEIEKPAGTRWSGTTGTSKQMSATTVEECEQACCADSDPLGCLAFTCALHAFLAGVDTPFGTRRARLVGVDNPFAIDVVAASMLME